MLNGQTRRGQSGRWNRGAGFNVDSRSSLDKSSDVMSALTVVGVTERSLDGCGA